MVRPGNLSLTDHNPQEGHAPLLLTPGTGPATGGPPAQGYAGS